MAQGTGIDVRIMEWGPFTHFVMDRYAGISENDPLRFAKATAARDAFLTMPVLNSMGYEVARPS